MRLGLLLLNNLNRRRLLSFALLCCSSSPCRLLSCSNLLCSRFWRLNLDEFLGVALSLDSLNKHSGISVTKVKPELVAASSLVAYESMLIGLWKMTISTKSLEAEAEFILIHDGLDSLNSSNLVLLRSDDRVVVRQELAKGLTNILDFVIIDVEHLSWNHLLVKAVLHCGIGCVSGLESLLCHD